MTTLFGNNQSDIHPDVVTYFDTTDGKSTIGYWSKGKLYLVQGGYNNSGDTLLASSSTKHIALTVTDQVIVLNSKDYSSKKLDQYFVNIYTDHTDSHAIQVKGSGQTIVFKSNTPIESASKDRNVRHALEGLMKLVSSKNTSTYLLALNGQFILGLINGGKLEHFKIINEGDLSNIGYHTLAFYQQNEIAPETILTHTGLTTDQISLLGTYLPQLEQLQVPSIMLSHDLAAHTDLIPHYLAYSCVS